MLKVSKDEAHRFYDRKVSYIVANILKDWYHKEVNTRSNFDNTNRGSIWKNKEKKSENQPDFNGSLNVTVTTGMTNYEMRLLLMMWRSI